MMLPLMTLALLYVVPTQPPGQGFAPGFGQSVQPGPPEPFSLTLPGQGWSLSFESPPLTNLSGQATRSGFQFRGSWPGGYSVTVTSEAAPAKTSRHEDAYEHYWPLAQRGPTIDPATLRVEKGGGRYVKVSYRTKPLGFPVHGGGATRFGAGAVKPDGGETKTQPTALAPHANYYFAVKGNWVDVHITRSTAGSDDQENLARFERTLNYREGANR